MFHPAANRLAGFLEISALSIALAQSGGSQYKAGLLRIKPSSGKGGYGRKNASWRDKQKQRWCAVRESYLVVLEEMGEVGYAYICSTLYVQLIVLNIADRIRHFPVRSRLQNRKTETILPTGS